MTTRAEEIAAEGPYTVEAFEIKRTLKPQIYFRVVGPTPTGLHSTTQKYAANRLCDRLNAAYKQGQQDRWISVDDRLPEEFGKQHIAFAFHPEWAPFKDGLEPHRVSSCPASYLIHDVKGRTDGTVPFASHWMPLPSPPNPEQP